MPDSIPGATPASSTPDPAVKPAETKATPTPTPAAPSTTTPAPIGATPAPSKEPDIDALKNALRNEAAEKESLEKKKQGAATEEPFKMDGGETFKMAMAAFKARMIIEQKKAEAKAKEQAKTEPGKEPKGTSSKDSPAPGSTTVSYSEGLTATPEQKIYNTADQLLAILETNGKNSAQAEQMWKTFTAANPDKAGKGFFACLEEAIGDVQALSGGPKYMPKGDPDTGQDALSKIRDWATAVVKNEENIKTIKELASEANTARADIAAAATQEPASPKAP